MKRGARMLAALLALFAAACGGGGSGDPATGGTPVAAAPSPAARAYTPPAQEALTSADVGRIVAQAIGEANARRLPAVIAVTDRVGNVLAVFRMTGARDTATVPLPASGVGMDVQGVTFPAALGAISKALTGAYLSSSGNAFSTRTASQIVQERFPPAPSTIGLESGPLFGVQFSQLPCSDLSTRYDASGGAGALIGPKRAPLGLSADPGGLPLYKNGVVVGGIGVMADGQYGLDADILDVDDDAEEAIAVAGGTGFAPSRDIAADRISVDGTTLRYSDVRALASTPAAARDYDTVAASAGTLIAVPGYYAPALIAGTAYGSEESGLRAAKAAEFANADAFVLTDGNGVNRYPIVAAGDAGDVAVPLAAAEVRALLESAFATMTRTRAQIRRPLDSRAQVSIAVVDTRGSVLGIVRAPDAPIFGTDVALQKARTAAFFSGRNAAADLSADPSADVRSFVAATRGFLGDPAALTGRTAFTARAIGNLSRPYFPDGEVARGNGPLSRPAAQFSPFSTGLQSALVIGNLAAHIGSVANGTPDTPRGCTALSNAGGAGARRLANGIQIFPGSVPIYRNDVLIGAIGVSGDGIDQDDMISFLGLAGAGGIANAPAAIRSDRIVVSVAGNGVRLRYVGCPFAPFLDTADQNACAGK
ncbi:heme-binding protein [Sphingomonas aliaeris]|uniref:Heme-binding protein n=1 Tax=Sphingomonas aliaeris TaxID=2759526 RepID=A0A974S4K7_9SPHN|nr:heme-binding protein [Sphingomonas aliaeris]QQV77682.1 heme-binding protein [Sphingomonas aliaeris]